MSVVWEHYPDFSASEFVCRCGCGQGADQMRAALLDKLQEIRTRLGRPLTITSGYRCPDHNQAVSQSGRDGPHTLGVAADVAVAGKDAWTVLALATQLGVPRIGVAQKGDHASSFLHLDVLDTPIAPWIWSY